MSPEQFATWLEGFLAGAGKGLTSEQTTLVAAKLASVRVPVIPIVISPPVYTPMPIMVPYQPPLVPSPWIPNPIAPRWRQFEITCGAPSVLSS